MKWYSHYGLTLAIAVNCWSTDAEARPGHRDGEGIRAKLNLSDEQKAQLQSFREEMRAELEGIRAQVKDGSLSREDAHASRRELLQGRREERRAIFTADQLEQLDQLRAEHAESDRPRHRHRTARGHHRAGHLLEKLELSVDQQTQLESLRQRHRAALVELKDSEDRSREGFKALRDQHRSDIAGILTAAQREQLEQLKAERRARFEESGEKLRRRAWRRARAHSADGAAGDGSSTVTQAAVNGTSPTVVETESWGTVKEKGRDREAR